MVLDLTFKKGGKVVGKNQPTFIIAEIGQNHQGNIQTAKVLIEAAKECGADCVKLQKTCIYEKYSKSVLQKPYRNQNSWGDTYEDHKQCLEFSEDQFVDLQKFASKIGILFAASPMDYPSLKFLKTLDMPFIKIGSGDCNNLPFIESAAQANVPLIVSTGMQNLEMVQSVYKTISAYHKKFCLLHCVSAYPAPLDDINLSVLKLYEEKFPDVIIGYSGHEIGIDISVAAVALGAKVIERHITLNHNQKGSDHICSLEPCEFKLLVQKIRTLEVAMGSPIKELRSSEVPFSRKFTKSIVLAHAVRKGHRLSLNDLKIKVADPIGIQPSSLNDIIGKIVKRNLGEDESLTYEALY
ncbi:hypothetical protein PPYR_04313 [Photinus pyralis]|uniref:AFP-like domain-containing protein n=1 Tax=Photinus pyralis TaxID=7054 RepID=A0A1Y1LEF8_PHOPY|nr:sialic acid synthase [Photinus pyralis]KAB0802127.1 hypothetical protein PPYR_04313 [Photinus pyralis]